MRTLARAQDRTDIVRRLRALRPDSRRRWGRMSPHQMVCHLSDSFRLLTHRRAISRAPDVRFPRLIKAIALYAPLPWPRGVATRPEVDQERGGTRPGEFAADVAELERLLDVFVRDVKSYDGRMHPIFGPMSERSWLRWGYLHMDHHLRQFDL